MNNLFEGLHFYEIVLIFLGIILFLILSFALVYSILKDKNIKRLLAFFIFPIAMIGYPSIQKIGFEDGMLEIEKYTKDIHDNPSDTTAINELIQLIEDQHDHEITDPKHLLVVGDAYSVLGEDSLAIEYANKALEADPNNDDAKVLKAISEISEAVEDLNVTDEGVVGSVDLSDEEIKTLQENTRFIEKSGNNDIYTQIKLREAHFALNDTTKANDTLYPIHLVRPFVTLDTDLRHE